MHTCKVLINQKAENINVFELNYILVLSSYFHYFNHLYYDALEEKHSTLVLGGVRYF